MDLHRQRIRWRRELTRVGWPFFRSRPPQAELEVSNLKASLTGKLHHERLPFARFQSSEIDPMDGAKKRPGIGGLEHQETSAGMTHANRGESHEHLEDGLGGDGRVRLHGYDWWPTGRIGSRIRHRNTDWRRRFDE